jgi:hypothetical protein
MVLTDLGAQDSDRFKHQASDHGFDLLAICTKIREVSGASAAYPQSEY